MQHIDIKLSRIQKNLLDLEVKEKDLLKAKIRLSELQELIKNQLRNDDFKALFRPQSM